MKLPTHTARWFLRLLLGFKLALTVDTWKPSPSTLWRTCFLAMWHPYSCTGKFQTIVTSIKWPVSGSEEEKERLEEECLPCDPGGGGKETKETALSSLHIQKSHFRGLRAMKRNFKKQGDKDLSKRFRQLLRSNALPAVLFPREITHMAIVGDGGGASSRTPELPCLRIM
ncbi:hypothetical protein H671_2g5617 [Cricetulus griseus]|uniref:Uncharacterized protein n=1 Tax=Cricetulus griseus TaxID=10029 RepID=A0A098KXG2_CRIGR|nr:hypothetical protein H671_2g5617 [Cricetulus griseus]